MRPFFLKLWMILSILLSFIQASAYDFEVDGKFYNINLTPNFTCEITTGNTKYSGNIDIPSTVEYKGKTLSIIKIGDNAFYGCENLISVNIPNTVLEIGRDAFNGCINLEKVNLSQALTTIGACAFANCVKIQRMSFSSSLQTIQTSAFYGCTGLISVTIPHIVNLYESVFSNCEGLTEIELPGTIDIFGREVFYGCNNLKAVTFHKGIKYVPSRTFRGCNSLESVKLPDGITFIGEAAFYKCVSLKSIKLPESLMRIDDNAFCFCYALESVNIPEHVTEIGEYVFRDCSSLKSTISLKGITRVLRGTFRGCSNLESVELSERITSIGEIAFHSCSSLKSIKLPESLMQIDNYAFAFCNELESIKIPKNVRVIGLKAFLNCINLRTLKLEANEDYIQLNCMKSSSFGIESQWVFGGANVGTVITGRGCRISLDGIVDNSIDAIHGAGLNKVKNIILLDNSSASGWFGNSDETLVNVNIGQNVTDYPSDFTGYTKLETFSINEAVPPTCPKFTTTQYVDMTVYVPAGALSAYQNAEGWKNFWNIKEMETSGIDDIEVDTEKVEVGRYDILGRRVDESHRGFVIIRYSDGSSAKVINR